jgi:hypothetical protein
MWLELVRIIEWLNMKADVAYFKLVTCTNVLAIKAISRGLFHNRCKCQLRTSKLISTCGIKGE